MSIIKFFLKEDSHFQPKLTRSNVDRFNATEQLRRTKNKSQYGGCEVSIPVSFSEHNSGITISKQNHYAKFKFTEFMVPGDALLQKSNRARRI